MQRTSEGPLQRLVALLALHLERPIEQRSACEIVYHEVEEVDVRDPQAVLLLRDVIKQRAEIVPDPQLILGWIVKDVKCDLISDAAAAQERIGNDLGEDRVQAFIERSTHGATWMQRRTSTSWLAFRQRSTGSAIWTVCSLRLRVFSM